MQKLHLKISVYHLIQENSVLIKVIIYSRDFENVNQSHQI